MKVQYFSDTDTLHLEFRSGDGSETRELDENTVLDLDENGGICAITVEHASTRTDVQRVTLTCNGPFVLNTPLAYS